MNAAEKALDKLAKEKKKALEWQKFIYNLKFKKLKKKSEHWKHCALVQEKLKLEASAVVRAETQEAIEEQKASIQRELKTKIGSMSEVRQDYLAGGLNWLSKLEKKLFGAKEISKTKKEARK